MKPLFIKWHIIDKVMSTVVPQFGLPPLQALFHRITSVLRIAYRTCYHLLLPLSITLLLCLCFMLALRPVRAAMVLNSFDILVNLSTVTVEWSTASEHEVLAFELYYKKSEASQSQYQLIGKQVAQGNKDSGAIYRVDVTENISQGTVYCFRLKEITLNDERGEIIDRCGYGLQITPTASNVRIETTATITTTPSPTMTATLTENFLVSPTVQQPVIATTTPIVAEASTPDVTENEQELPTNDSTEIGESSPTSPVDSNPESPLPTPTPQPEAQLNHDGTVTASSASVLAEINTLTNTISQATPVAESPLATALPAAAVTNQDSPSYIVLTVTPTSAEIASAPTFTPFPTAGPIEKPNLIAAALPTTQNLMIVLLCGVFSGASGLGILGLVTTLLYMRARDTESRM